MNKVLALVLIGAVAGFGYYLFGVKSEQLANQADRQEYRQKVSEIAETKLSDKEYSQFMELRRQILDLRDKWGNAQTDEEKHKISQQARKLAIKQNEIVKRYMDEQ